ncbi:MULTISPECIES: YafY family protein [unclassified Methylophilus]|uniref:helix-turn-helix transcriptional regulator n=1 Tax=unclassified Methylophilus TaxID=2630143 RepID=UPI0006FCCFC9|nr:MULTISPECIES: WYL domain-containing protein [unclassified Methylophilus]KQT42605.1 hypothetical protein ASG34_07720 [Methylophilus sp. Leaf416]KQT56790.1 hypothetical protein ASG44_07695 [Methylophilus sp. Leaf459]
MHSIDHIGFAQRQRLQYIESVAYWEGLVGRKRISSVFDVSENHITQDFSLYRKAFPDQLDYDVSARSYRPSRKFRPYIGTGSADEYLSLLRTHVEGHSTAVLSAIGDGIVATGLPVPKSEIDAAVLREITRALRQGHGLKIRYQSMSHEAPRERTLWPHALVYAGLRWHVRAYDSLRECFGDFVLQRILTAKASKVKCPQDTKNDVEWHQEELVEVIPSASLSVNQARVIASEYGMKAIQNEFVWETTMKRCLVPYFLYWLRLDKDAHSPFIALKNPSLAERYKIGGEVS